MYKPRVLMIEDNLDISQLNEMTLAQAGFEVMMAKDGNEALNLLQQNKPDVVLTDLMMPGMDGIELIENIRTITALKNLPIFVLSAGSNDLLNKALAAGANKIIAKPIDPLSLWTQVWELVPMEEIEKGSSGRKPH